jgi:hypothetical protein
MFSRHSCTHSYDSNSAHANTVSWTYLWETHLMIRQGVLETNKYVGDMYLHFKIINYTLYIGI